MDSYLLLKFTLAVPLLGGIVILWFWRGWGRWPAIIPVVILAIAYAADFFQASQRAKGNLAGLFTMLAAPPAYGLLLILGLANLATWAYGRRSRHEKGPSAGGDVPELKPTPPL